MTVQSRGIVFIKFELQDGNCTRSDYYIFVDNAPVCYGEIFGVEGGYYGCIIQNAGMYTLKIKSYQNFALKPSMRYNLSVIFKSTPECTLQEDTWYDMPRCNFNPYDNYISAALPFYRIDIEQPGYLTIYTEENSSSDKCLYDSNRMPIENSLTRNPNTTYYVKKGTYYTHGYGKTKYTFKPEGYLRPNEKLNYYILGFCKEYTTYAKIKPTKTGYITIKNTLRGAELTLLDKNKRVITKGGTTYAVSKNTTYYVRIKFFDNEHNHRKYDGLQIFTYSFKAVNTLLGGSTTKTVSLKKGVSKTVLFQKGTKKRGSQKPAYLKITLKEPGYINLKISGYLYDPCCSCGQINMTDGKNLNIGYSALADTIGKFKYSFSSKKYHSSKLPKGTYYFKIYNIPNTAMGYLDIKWL